VRDKAGPVEIWTRKAPQHQAPLTPTLSPCKQGKPSEDAGGKGCGKRSILLVSAHSQDLVQGAPREPAAW